MITSLYDRYFQKSRSFLYPALGISRKAIGPVQTFISLDNRIKVGDRKLICLFNHETTPRYEEFETRLLLSNPLYMDAEIYKGGPSLYVFNFEEYGEDWDCFLKGHYSKFSSVFKDSIKHYYGEKSAEYKYIDTFLYPEKYFELYSKLLDMPLDTISQSGELCNQYDPEKENLIFSTNNLEK